LTNTKHSIARYKISFAHFRSLKVITSVLRDLYNQYNYKRIVSLLHMYYTTIAQCLKSNIKKSIIAHSLSIVFFCILILIDVVLPHLNDRFNLLHGVFQVSQPN